MVKYLREDFGRVGLLVVATPLTAAASLLGPVAVRELVRVLTNSGQLDRFIYLLALLLAGSLATVAYRSVLLPGMSARWEATLRVAALKAVIRARRPWTAEDGVAPLAMQIDQSSRGSADAIVAIASVTQRLLQIVGAVAFVWHLGGLQIAAAVSAMLLFVPLLAAQNSRITAIDAEYVRKQTRLTRVVFDLLPNIGTVRSYNSEDWYIDRVDDEAKSFVRTAREFNSSLSRLVLTNSLLSLALGALLPVFVLWSAQRGLILVEDAASISWAFAVVVSGVLRLSDDARTIQLRRKHVRQLKEFLSVPPITPSGCRPDSSRPSLVVDSLTVRYPGSNQDALSNVSLSLATGKALLVTGPSGGGKTTLLASIAGLVEASEGAVAVRGVIVDSTVSDSLRFVSLVGQDRTLLSGSLARNLAASKSLGSDSEFVDWRAFGEVVDFIGQLENAHLTPLGDQGDLLSLGQQQVALILTGLQERPDILLLDEATGHLDAPTERQILERAIEEQTKRGSIVVVSHRVSSFDLFDRAVVIDSGNLVEFGDPSELAGSGGHFAMLLDAQNGEPGLHSD